MSPTKTVLLGYQTVCAGTRQHHVSSQCKTEVITLKCHNTVGVIIEQGTNVLPK